MAAVTGLLFSCRYGRTCAALSRAEVLALLARRLTKEEECRLYLLCVSCCSSLPVTVAALRGHARQTKRFNLKFNPKLHLFSIRPLVVIVVCSFLRNSYISLSLERAPPAISSISLPSKSIGSSNILIKSSSTFVLPRATTKITFYKDDHLKNTMTLLVVESQQQEVASSVKPRVSSRQHSRLLFP